MQEFENKLGVFYLGKQVDPATGLLEDKVVLYESKDLTTHAVCVGMTGSGKTGLGVTLLEEAALDGIPALILDPKGDLGNLLLSFPNLSPHDFQPWIDAGEASRKGMTDAKYAEVVAKGWKEGLAKWGQSGTRIASYKNSVDRRIYTPASNAGIPLSILNSFRAPPPEIVSDTSEAFRDRVLSTTSSLLGLIGIAADPIKSKEHILISTIFTHNWKENRDLDLPTLIQAIQKPPFDKVGVFTLETFYPAKERLTLSIALNNLLASPGFSNWLEGEPLDIQKLLYTSEGKPRHAILSIAHLSDSERMFFVTLLLNELLAWVRKQTGTSSLRAILYMDEIFGFFPPVSTPPSKLPMLTLLKQARAYGLGIVLATQNPVDLDYKGLSNCGTWFLGKLQTERDRARVLEGLQAASKAAMGTAEINQLLAACGNRIFIMCNVHQPQPILFQTRWALSYLRGPLTLPQIEILTNQLGRPKASDSSSLTGKSSTDNTAALSQKPSLPSEIVEYTVKSKATATPQVYRPLLLGIAKLHFVDGKNKIDTWEEKVFIAPFSDDGLQAQWEAGNELPHGKESLTRDVPKEGKFEDLPAGSLQIKNYQAFGKAYATFLYQNQMLHLYQAPALKLTSKQGESEGDFKIRLSMALREQRDKELEKIKNTYAQKMQNLQEKIHKANEKLTKQQSQKGLRIFESIVAFIKAILAFFSGRKTLNESTISQAGTVLNKAGKVSQNSQKASAIEEEITLYAEQLSDMQQEMQSELAKATAAADINNVDISIMSIRPRKTDIDNEAIAIVWLPL